MKSPIKKLLAACLCLLVSPLYAAEPEHNIFNDPEWFPVDIELFSLLYDTDEQGYVNRSLVIQSSANDRNRYAGASLDFMEFSDGSGQFGIYGHMGYRPKWTLAPFIQADMDLYNPLIELLSGNGLRFNTRLTAGLQWNLGDAFFTFFYRSSYIDLSHLPMHTGSYTSYGISFGAEVGRQRRWQRNPPVVAYSRY